MVGRREVEDGQPPEVVVEAGKGEQAGRPPEVSAGKEEVGRREEEDGQPPEVLAGKG